VAIVAYCIIEQAVSNAILSLLLGGGNFSVTFDNNPKGLVIPARYLRERSANVFASWGGTIHRFLEPNIVAPVGEIWSSYAIAAQTSSPLSSFLYFSTTGPHTIKPTLVLFLTLRELSNDAVCG